MALQPMLVYFTISIRLHDQQSNSQFQLKIANITFYTVHNILCFLSIHFDPLCSTILLRYRDPATLTLFVTSLTIWQELLLICIVGVRVLRSFFNSNVFNCTPPGQSCNVV